MYTAFLTGFSGKRNGERPYLWGAAGIAGALTNTLLVMNMIFLFFRDAYAAANNTASETVYLFILTIIGINGVPEAIVAALLTALVGRIILKAKII